jgi:hypothetical protein
MMMPGRYRLRSAYRVSSYIGERKAIMKNAEVRARVIKADPASQVFIINPDIDGNDYESWPVKEVTWVVSPSPADTVIEANPDAMASTITAAEFLPAVERFEEDGDVQVFVKGWESQEFAYFDIKQIRIIPEHGRVLIVLGAWRCGG